MGYLNACGPAEFLGQADEQAAGPADVAEQVDVLIADDLADELCAARAAASVSSRSSTANITRR